MLKNKSCSNCNHSKNVREYATKTLWDCSVTPFKYKELLCILDNEFKTFHCSKWVDVFTKDKE